MIVLLPPSESKAAGGASGSVLDLEALSFPGLRRARGTAVAALQRAAKTASEPATAAARRWLDDNRSVRRSPVMPAIERYDGVVYSALDVATLGESARAWVSSSVVIGSALFGLLRADDAIPSYKLAHSGLKGELRGLWRPAWRERELTRLFKVNILLVYYGETKSSLVSSSSPCTRVSN